MQGISGGQDLCSEPATGEGTEVKTPSKEDEGAAYGAGRFRHTPKSRPAQGGMVNVDINDPTARRTLEESCPAQEGK